MENPSYTSLSSFFITKFRDIKKKVKDAVEIIEEFQDRFSKLGFVQRTEMQYSIKQNISQEERREVIKTLFELAERIKEKELVE